MRDMILYIIGFKICSSDYLYEIVLVLRLSLNSCFNTKFNDISNIYINNSNVGDVNEVVKNLFPVSNNIDIYSLKKIVIEKVTIDSPPPFNCGF